VTVSKRFEVVVRADRVDITFDDGGMNLLSSDALAELGEAIRHVQTVRCDLVTFRSGRANLFAAGADMSEMQHFGAREAEEFSRAGQELFDAIEKLPMLTIAFVDGDCFGGALDLAMAFDLRIATARSRFSHPGARLGIITGFGGTSRWRSIITPAIARRLFLGNEIFTSTQALDGGLIDRIADDVDFQMDPARVRAIKDIAPHVRHLSQRELVDLCRHLERLYDSEQS
jgi:enoyl-CoA hydratase